MTSAILNESPTTSASVMLHSKNTAAVDKFNDEDFSRSYNDRLLGLYEVWNNSMLAGENLTTQYLFPLAQFITSTYKISEEDSTIRLLSQVSQWRDKHIENIATIYESILSLWGIVSQREEAEKELFIRENNLWEAIGCAYTLINQFFTPVIKIQDELYIDPEEPEIKFLNISITPKSVTESDIPTLLEEFDELQDHFLKTLDTKYTSLITFHLDIP